MDGIKRGRVRKKKKKKFYCEVKVFEYVGGGIDCAKMSERNEQ
jgi:hypothetical protein